MLALSSEKNNPLIMDNLKERLFNAFNLTIFTIQDSI